jgi:hypothetical protein
MTLRGNWIRCDDHRCETETLFDVRTISTGAKYPEDIRRWFDMDGWTSKPGEGGSEGKLDFCPVHRGGLA